MDLGRFETHLLRVLRQRFGDDVALHAGPPFTAPTTGARAEVFVHAARFADLGGRTAEGARVGRQPLQVPPGASGFTEERPGTLDLEVTCVGPQAWQAQWLAGTVAPLLLHALETLRPPLLTDPSDPDLSLRFTDHRAFVHACESSRQDADGVAVHQVRVTLRLEGFLHARLARPGGLPRDTVYALETPRVTLHGAPDLEHQRVELRNETGFTVDLAGWILRDGRRRPSRYAFPSPCLVGDGRTLTLWAGRGQDDPANLHWGRRRPPWADPGAVAILVDPDGVERARAIWPPSPVAVPAGHPSPPIPG